MDNFAMGNFAIESFVTGLIGAAWLSIFAVLVWGIVSGWRRQLRDDSPLPLLRLLELEGVSAAQAEDALGAAELVRAVSRCASCAARTACESGAIGGWAGRRPVGCPNAPLFERLGGRAAG